MPRRSADGWRNRCSRRAPRKSPYSIRYNEPMTARASIDARPLAGRRVVITRAAAQASAFARLLSAAGADVLEAPTIAIGPRSEEHTSELQSRLHLVCRLLLEKKKKKKNKTVS